MELVELGLTKNESKAFETIVKLGKSSAAQISKESEVPYSRIYNVLASLEHKALIKVIPEKGKKFVPGDPESLKELIRKKKKLLADLDKEVDKLKKTYDIKVKEPVEIARGKRNFYKLIKELPEAKKSSYSIKYTAEYQPEWEREYRRYIKKGIKVKQLVRVDGETAKNLKKWLRLFKDKANMKRIPNEGVAISIIDDSTILIALIKSNVIMLITDTPFVKLMKELFNNYYDNSVDVAKLLKE